MIDRYQRKQLKEVWSEENKYAKMLQVEIAASQAWCRFGLFDEDTLSEIKQATFDIEEIKQLETITKHDIIAFTRNLSDRMKSDAKKYIHYGLTSTDVVDTTNGLLLKEANYYIEEGIKDVMGILKGLALEYKNTLSMGRTHGMHADITSFGLKFLLFYDEFQRHLQRFRVARKEVEVGLISGAVGNYANIDPFIEKEALKILGLNKMNITTQVLPRDLHANYIHTLALIGTTLEKIATEIRHLSRTEVGELREGFSKGQKGSSAMPHKKNPISSENVTGLARLLRSYTMPAYENNILWHERDISHSSVERVILVDSTTLIDYALQRMYKLLDELYVDTNKIEENIHVSFDTVYAQRFMHKLIEKGLSREQAYDAIQMLSSKAYELKESLITIIKKDQMMRSYLSSEDIENCISNDYYLKHVDYIYEAVLK